jgi:hypothetical protein
MRVACVHRCVHENLPNRTTSYRVAVDPPLRPGIGRLHIGRGVQDRARGLAVATASATTRRGRSAAAAATVGDNRRIRTRSPSTVKRLDDASAKSTRRAAEKVTMRARSVSALPGHLI